MTGSRPRRAATGRGLLALVVVAAVTASGAPASAAAPAVASGGAALMADGPTAVWPIGAVVALQPGNYPAYRVRHSGFVARIDDISPASSELDQADSQFVVRTGLGSAAGVSFEATNYPGFFLAVEGDGVALTRGEGIADFAARATFLPGRGLTGRGVSLAVLGDPDLYLRHEDFVLHARPNDGSDRFREDATFLPVVTKPAPATPATPSGSSGVDAPKAAPAPGPSAPAALAPASSASSASSASASDIPVMLAPPVAGPGGTFTVATYNVSGLPQLFNSAASERGPASREIGERLNAYDIINVQEDLNYHADLYDRSRHPFRTPTTGGAGIGFGSNTMSTKPINAWRRVGWQDCAKGSGDCIGPKGFQLIQVEIAPGVIVDVYNLHTDAGSDPDDIGARRGNLKQLVGYIAQHSAGRAVIVAGDTNTRYTREGEYISQFAAETGLRDAWVQVLRGGQEPKVGDGLACDNKNITDPKNCEVVDKIFYRSGGGIELTAAGFSLPHDAFSQGGVMLSDHDPLVVTFRWSGQGDPAAGPLTVDEGVKLAPVTAVLSVTKSLFNGIKSLFG